MEIKQIKDTEEMEKTKLIMREKYFGKLNFVPAAIRDEIGLTKYLI